MEKYIPRFFQIPGRSFFLFGPRGTGKSTFLKHNFPQALFLDLLKPGEFRQYSAKPERLIELIEGNLERNTIIVDEIQKIPDLLDVVHFLVEKYQEKKFILTGSSARKLKRKGIDLLAGRVLLKRMHPFLYSEVKKYFGFNEVLEYGLVPVVLSSGQPADVLDSYISLYMKEEVQLEGFVRNFGNFSRFLEAVSFSHGSVLNISNVARECEVERKTVEGYIEILEDILLADRIQTFRKRAKRALVKHPKFYFFDTGVYKTLRPRGPFDRPEEINGIALEGLVYQNLKGWISYSGRKYELYYWRSVGGVEVDFVLYGENDITAIEVKNSDKIRFEDLRSLKEFGKDYPQSKKLLLYNGKEKLLRNNIMCIPVEEFIGNLYPDKPLPF